jgi:hypothetical protein
MGHKGLRQYASDEYSSLAFNQMGTTKMTGRAGGSNYYTYHAGSGTDDSNNLYFPNIVYWAALKNPYSVAANAGCQARAYGNGDDLAADGTFDDTDASNNINIGPGDTVYGAWDKIYMDSHNEHLIATIGK